VGETASFRAKARSMRRADPKPLVTAMLLMPRAVSSS
jgi:hypothetical protein